MAPTSSDLPTAKKARLESATYTTKMPEMTPGAAYKKRGRSIRPRSAPPAPGLKTPPTSTPTAHRRGRRLQPIEAAPARTVLASTFDVDASRSPGLESWDMAATASILSSAFATASWQPTTPPTDKAHELSLLHGLRSSFALTHSGAPMRPARTLWSSGPSNNNMQHLATPNHAWNPDFGASIHDVPRYLHGDDETKRHVPLRRGSTLATATLHLAALEALLADDADDEFVDTGLLPPATTEAWPYYV